MYIKKIELNNFRNYLNQEIILDKNINVFYGNNAQGKTNIIESIFLCAMGKSFRVKKEKELINFEKQNMSVEIEFQKKDRDGNIKIEISDKKNIFLNKIKLKKLSELVGNINVVMFSPDDIDIIKGGPANRRRFLNIMISQLRPNYLYNLNLYLKTIEQKNSLLRQMEKENIKEDLLDIWDEKLAQYGFNIYNYRKEFIEKIINKISNIHSNITENKEIIKLKYISDCDNKEQYLNKLKEDRKKDILRGYTSKGIHRDDFYIYINGKQVDIYGSQGQQRTVVLSLKLSELEVFNEELNEYPILLLDDFMSELDEIRKNNFLNNIKNTQIIITCTEDLEVDNISCKKYKVEKGTVIYK